MIEMTRYRIEMIVDIHPDSEPFGDETSLALYASNQMLRQPSWTSPNTFDIRFKAISAVATKIEDAKEFCDVCKEQKNSCLCWICQDCKQSFRYDADGAHFSDIEQFCMPCFYKRGSDE